MFAHCSASSQSALCRLSRQWGTMTSIVPLLGIITCVLLVVRCSAAHSFKQCAVADLRVNCTSVSLSHVPIIFNPRLTQLTLRDTGITQLGQSRPLDVYTRVEYLDLSHNGLANIPDGAFRNQKVLRVLNLSANALSSVTKKPFEGLHLLESLLLANNQINETSVESFAALSKLTILSLGDNRLTEVPTDVLRELSSLEQLDLGGNLFEVIERDSFPLTRLKSLDLSRNTNLQAIRDGALSGASNLQQLILSHNPLLLLENKNVFDGLSKLQVLNLSFNKMLTYLHPELFAATRDLRFLSLQSCSFSVIDARIANLAPNLQFLDVRDNSLTCNCSVQWIRSHFLNQRNHSSSSSPEPEQSVGTTVLAAVIAALPNYQSSSGAAGEEHSTSHTPLTESATAVPQYLSLDWLTKRENEHEDQDSPHKSRPVLSLLAEKPAEETVQAATANSANAVQLLLRELEEARCSDPSLLKDNRLIDLGPDMTGCFKSESMAPIVIVALAVGVAVGVIIILIVRFRERLTHCLSFRRDGKKRKRPYDLTRSSFLPSPISVSSNKFNPTPVSTLHVNNNRKVFHGFDPVTGTTKSSQRSLARMPFDEFGSLSSKPEFIFVHNTINLRGNNRSIGDFSNGGADAGARSDFIQPIYRPRHVINNLRNNPYEVVPIVPPVASHPSSHRNWSHHILHQHPAEQLPYHLQTQQPHFSDPGDPDDPFNFYERTYEEAECPLNHLTPSTEL